MDLSVIPWGSLAYDKTTRIGDGDDDDLIDGVGEGGWEVESRT